MNEPLAALRQVIEAGGGPLADTLADSGDADPALGALAAAGGRGDRHPDYALPVESIFEGYLLHYAQPRLFDALDRDLALLGGDFLYAFGLTRLAQIGDLEAIGDLADLITLCAQLHASPDRPPDPRLLAALWATTALSVGCGRWSAHEQAKQDVRDGLPGVADATLACAAQRADELGLKLDLDRALIVFTAALADQPRTT